MFEDERTNRMADALELWESVVALPAFEVRTTTGRALSRSLGDEAQPPPPPSSLFFTLTRPSGKMLVLGAILGCAPRAAAVAAALATPKSPLLDARALGDGLSGASSAQVLAARAGGPGGRG